VELFETALEHAGHVEMPFDQALLQFAYGEFLRRAGERTRAGEQLHAARQVLTRLGARPDLERCDRELAACGLTVEPPRARDTAALTAQETAVARLAGAGLTNRGMILSVKTIEYHLHHVYAKLGVRSRAQLARHLAAE
jgi:DNA-binding CsgD family transcriptional regulator